MITRIINAQLANMIAMLMLMLTIIACSAGGGTKNNVNTEDRSEARNKMETEAQARLSMARAKLAQMQCGEAKAIVIKMRKDCYLALSARKEGILLMDSIDIQQAKLELSKADSLMQKQHSISTSDDFDEACRKVQFYERKLQYDSRSTNK
jgi:predicted regulator of Ras-like GTPase activity (Roadblock/LC7/MglB family)